MYSKYYTEFKRKGQKSPQVDLLAELERRNKEQQQENQQQSSNNMSNMRDMYDRFANKPATGATGSLYGGSGAGTTAALNNAGMANYGAMSTQAVMAGEGGVAGTGYLGGAGAAGGSGGFGGAAASFWPAWVVAAAVVNEKNARDGGYRSENDREYWEHLLGGKVMEQDAENRWNKLPDKWFGDENDSMGLGGHMKFDGNLFSGDFSNAWKNLKEDDVGAKFIKKLGKIF